MALNITGRDADRLARELAKETGETITQAVTAALRERLSHLRRRHRGRRLADELDGIAKRCARLPVLDTRPAEEILGLDERGMPG